jgi:cob(I)alamin adenosyltransferase
MKVYTKTGDNGETSLLGGNRVPKNHLRIEAYGTVDELNAFVGLLRDHTSHPVSREHLYQIQNTLFVLGSNLASAPGSHMVLPLIDQNEVESLERAIDDMDTQLEPLKNFILPGGHPAISHAHLARCVCRRAERICVALNEDSPVDPTIIRFLNRLSDYFFVLGRFLAKELGVQETIWRGRH